MCLIVGNNNCPESRGAATSISLGLTLQANRFRPSGTIFIALTLVVVAGAAPLRADDAEQVDKFLARLGLVDLQILHLEQTLDHQTDPAAQLQSARRLADLYAGRLMEAADDPQRYGELLAGIEELTQRFPQANTTALAVMLLQADYNRAEALVGKWLADADDAASREEAAAILARIAPKLNDYQEELNEKVEKLSKQIDDLPNGDDRDEKENQLARDQAVAGRATYFAGWSSYYQGLTRDERAAAAQDFMQAGEIFRKLLALTGEDADYSKVEVEWLGLESIWRARTVIGLGLAEAAVGNVKASGMVFGWLDSPSVAPQVRDQAAYWYVQGLLNAKNHQAAREYAAPRVEKFSGAATQGKISLCVALVRAGFGGAVADAQAAKALGDLGIKGLVKLRQFPVLKTLLEKYDVDLADDGGFYLTWLRGQQKFDIAEKTKSDADYQAAAELLTTALAGDEARSDVASAAHCRYNRGWCRYRLEEYLPAAEDFEQASTGLKNSDPDTAAQSAWLAFASHRQLVPTSATAAGSAIAMLERIKADFPGSKFAAQADYQIAKLRTSASTPAESIAALRKIKPTEANYLSARYDLCQLLHQQWQAQRGDAEQAKLRLEELRQAVDVYQKAAGPKEPDRQIAALMKVVEGALGTKPPDLPAAEDALANADALAARVPEDNNAVLAEYHYYALQMARQRNDDAARRTHAQWIVDNAAGSRFEMPALVTVATALDSRIEDADKSQLPVLYAEALDVYSRLVQSLGDTPEILKSQKNARVSLGKQAHYASLLGRHDEAAAALEKLLAEFPKDSQYLRRAGLASYHAGRYETSLGYWETLLRGLPAGDEGWLEAKHYQIAALAKTDNSAAAAVYKQFALLYPDLGGDLWRAKFEALARQLK